MGDKDSAFKPLYKAPFMHIYWFILAFFFFEHFIQAVFSYPHVVFPGAHDACEHFTTNCRGNERCVPRKSSAGRILPGEYWCACRDGWKYVRGRGCLGKSCKHLGRYRFLKSIWYQVRYWRCLVYRYLCPCRYCAVIALTGVNWQCMWTAGSKYKVVLHCQCWLLFSTL